MVPFPKAEEIETILDRTTGAEKPAASKVFDGRRILAMADLARVYVAWARACHAHGDAQATERYLARARSIWSDFDNPIRAATVDAVASELGTVRVMGA